MGDAQNALMELGELATSEDIKTNIERLIDNGTLQEWHIAGKVFLRYALDPEAEYLAAIYWTSCNANDQNKWDEWLQWFNKKGLPF